MTILRMMEEINEFLTMVQKQFGISAVAIKINDELVLHEGKFQQKREGLKL